MKKKNVAFVLPFKLRHLLFFRMEISIKHVIVNTSKPEEAIISDKRDSRRIKMLFLKKVISFRTCKSRF